VKKYPRYIIKVHRKIEDKISYNSHWLYKLCNVVWDKQNIECMKNAGCKRYDCPYCYSINIDAITDHKWTP